MPKDFFQNARRIVEQAIGEKMDGSQLEDPLKEKDPAAVKRGKLGGVKGGKNRAAKLPPAKRSEIAKNAARARWKRNDAT